MRSFRIHLDRSVSRRHMRLANKHNRRRNVTLPLSVTSLYLSCIFIPKCSLRRKERLRTAAAPPCSPCRSPGGGDTVPQQARTTFNTPPLMNLHRGEKKAVVTFLRVQPNNFTPFLQSWCEKLLLWAAALRGGTKEPAPSGSVRSHGRCVSRHFPGVLMRLHRGKPFKDEIKKFNSGINYLIT